MKKMTYYVYTLALALALNTPSAVHTTPQEPTLDAQSAHALFDIHAQSALCPETIEELQIIVRAAYDEGKKIVIKGAGKSQGGQTVSSQPSYRISLEKINKLLNLDVQNKQVTIQAGATWAQLQHAIAPHRLAVTAMQSYNDFSIGGSLGVNVHGQDLKSNPLITSVQSFTILLADGSLVFASRTQNTELFNAAIGGYGLLGIVTDVTLDLTDDILLDRKATVIDATYCADHFYTCLKGNPNVVFASGRLSIDDTKTLEKAIVISYEKSQNKSPELFALHKPNNSWWRKSLMGYMATSRMLKRLRFPTEVWFNQKPETISRNNFLNYSITGLPQETDTKRYILQEYFIPAFPYNDSRNMHTFIAHFRTLIKQYNINVLNVSARYVKKDTEALLSFAHHDACAFVLFIEVPKTTKAYAQTIEWTQKLIDVALACSGTYYLPYQLIATQEQFEKVYPNWWRFVELKRMYDPHGLFTNQLYEKYAHQ